MSGASQHFELRLFSETALSEALSGAGSSPAFIRRRSITQYLVGYLTDLGAQTILVEFDYVDGDYLDDYAAYYSRCFTRYDKHCKRLHFFTRRFNSDEFVAAISEPVKSAGLRSALRDSYLGFVVARPLPEAVIGRTVLATYPPDVGRNTKAGDRRFTAVHRYEANLFGLDLTIESLAFQEQDTVLAACATVALWSSFHQAAHLFRTPRPRPAEITRAANDSVSYSRAFPSHGLVVEQMCRAIRSVGLEPEIFDVGAGSKLRHPMTVPSLLYAYLSLGLPVVLGVMIDGVGLHAVTVTGYRRTSSNLAIKKGADPAEPVMVSSQIDRLYVHDDQIGPFARLTVKRPKGSTAGGTITFEGSWRNQATKEMRKLFPYLLIVPVYHKIRVTFVDVQDWVRRMHQLVCVVLDDQAQRLVWDVRLTDANTYKRSVSVAKSYPDRASALFGAHPRFVWIASLRKGENLLFEWLADATGVARSFPFYKLVWHDENLRKMMLALLQLAEFKHDVIQTAGPAFLEFLEASAVE